MYVVDISYQPRLRVCPDRSGDSSQFTAKPRQSSALTGFGVSSWTWEMNAQRLSVEQRSNPASTSAVPPAKFATFVGHMSPESLGRDR